MQHTKRRTVHVRCHDGRLSHVLDHVLDGIGGEELQSRALADLGVMLLHYPKWRQLDVPNRRPSLPPQHRTPPCKPPSRSLVADLEHRPAPQLSTTASRESVNQPRSGGAASQSSLPRHRLAWHERLHATPIGATCGAPSASSTILERGAGSRSHGLARHEAVALVRSRAHIGLSVATSASASALLGRTTSSKRISAWVEPPQHDVDAIENEPQMVDRAMAAIDRERRWSSAALRRIELLRCVVY